MSLGETLVDLARSAWGSLEPATWEVGEHVAKERGGFGDPGAETEYVCVECGESAPTREELAELEHWEEAG